MLLSVLKLTCVTRCISFCFDLNWAPLNKDSMVRIMERLIEQQSWTACRKRRTHKMVPHHEWCVDTIGDPWRVNNESWMQKCHPWTIVCRHWSNLSHQVHLIYFNLNSSPLNEDTCWMQKKHHQGWCEIPFVHPTGWRCTEEWLVHQFVLTLASQAGVKERHSDLCGCD